MAALPIVNVQPSLPTVVQEVYGGLIPYEDVWVSCYASQKPSVHAKIRVVLDERRRDQVNYLTKGDVEVKHVRDGVFSVSCKSLHIPPLAVITPIQEYSDPDTSNPQRPKRITAFDVSPDSTQYAVGHLDGSVYIYPTSPLPASRPKYTPQTITAPSHLRKRAKPHLSAVSSLQYFPSSRVLLTAGVDFTLAILPADPFPSPQPQSSPSRRTQETQQRLSPVRTLRSHTRPITSTGIIPPGKSILSSSLDGTVKLWDVPSGEVVSTIIAKSPILSMSVGEEHVQMSMDGASSDAHHLAFCGLQNGHFEAFDTRANVSIFYSPDVPSLDGGGLSSITYSSSMNLLATGSSRGFVAVYDVRSLSSPSGEQQVLPNNVIKPLTTFRRNEATIDDLVFAPGLTADAAETRLAIATSDGLPFIASLSPHDRSLPDSLMEDKVAAAVAAAVAAELAGTDCDAVRGIRIRDRQVWCGMADAVVRRYEGYW